MTRTQDASTKTFHAHISFSVQNNELTIYCPTERPDFDTRHQRKSLDGILLHCCSPTKPFKSKTISLYDVLSARLHDKRLSISIIRHHHRKSPVKTLVIDNPSVEESEAFVANVWRAAYRNGAPRKRVKVLLNPFGGSGQAKIIWEKTVLPIFSAAEYTVDVEETQYSGHAADISKKLILADYDAIVCVSGDGLPHEVVNGLAQRKDALHALQMPIGFIPAGSGNGSAKSIYDTQKHVECALAVVKGFVTPVDLISMTQGNQRFMSYFSLSYGVIADCDLGTEHLRWMGEARFTYGVVQRILTRTTYPCTLSLSVMSDDKRTIQSDYHNRTVINPESLVLDTASSRDFGLPELKYGTVNDPVPAGWTTKRYPRMGTFYAGLMPYMSSSACFFPTASPATGSIDVLHIQADIPFISALNTISAVDKAKHFGSDLCYYAKCDAFRLVPELKKGFISVDGESFPFTAIQGEVHHALGRIITKNGQYYSQFSE